jgi:integrase
MGIGMNRNVIKEVLASWTGESSTLPNKNKWDSSNRPGFGVNVTMNVAAVPLNSQMTFSTYVECKFVPDHVQYKTRAGQTHYQAMLKHILTPESVNRIFGKVPYKSRSLQSIPDWPYLDDVRLCDLTTDHFRKLVFAATQHGYSAQTLKHIKTVAGAVISHARTKGFFNRPNPAAQVKLPPLTHGRRQVLSARQISQALGMMQSPERELALLSIYTGLTVTAICDLRWRDLNLTFLPCIIDGERLPPISLRVRRKSSRSDRNVDTGKSMGFEIPGPVLPGLLDLRSQRVDADPDDYVFVSRGGGQITPAHLQSGLRQIGVCLGIPTISWQDFRKFNRILAVEFVLNPYSSSTADVILPSSIRSMHGIPFVGELICPTSLLRSETRG